MRGSVGESGAIRNASYSSKVGGELALAPLLRLGQPRHAAGLLKYRFSRERLSWARPLKIGDVSIFSGTGDISVFHGSGDRKTETSLGYKIETSLFLDKVA